MDVTFCSPNSADLATSLLAHFSKDTHHLILLLDPKGVFLADFADARATLEMPLRPGTAFTGFLDTHEQKSFLDCLLQAGKNKSQSEQVFHFTLPENRKMVFSAAFYPAPTETGEHAVLFIAEDHTRLYQVEDQVRMYEEQAIQNNDLVQDALWEWHLPSGELFLNYRWFEMLNYQPAAFTTTVDNLKKMIHPDDKPRLNAALESVIRLEAPSFECEYRMLTSSGVYKWLLASGWVVQRDQDLKAIRLAGVNIDIDIKKRQELATLQSEEHYRTLFENIPIPLWEEDFSEAKNKLDALRASGVSDFSQYFQTHPEAVLQFAELVEVRDVNRAAVNLLEAYNKAQLIGKLSLLITSANFTVFMIELISIADGFRVFETETPMHTLSKREMFITLRLQVVPGHESTYDKVIISTLDITKRRNAELEVEANEQKFRSIIEQSSDGISMVNSEGTIIEWNASAEQVFGIPKTEALEKKYWDIQFRMALLGLRTPEYLDQLRRTTQQFLKDHHAAWANQVFESEIYRPDGSQRTIQSSIFPIQTAHGFFAGSINRDVTDLKRAELALRQSEKKFRNLFNATILGIVIYELVEDDSGNPLDLRIIETNPQYDMVTGYDSAKIIGKTIHEAFPTINMETYERLMQVALTEEPQQFIHYSKTAKRTFQMYAFSPQKGQTATLVVNVTERVRAEAALRQKTEDLARLYEISQYLLIPSDATFLLEYICQTMVDTFGYPMAWIGTLDHEKGVVTPLFVKGKPSNYFDGIRITWDNSPYSKGPTGKAITSKQSVVINDIQGDKDFVTWKDHELYRDFQSTVSFPLIYGDEILGVLGVYHPEKEYFTYERTLILQSFLNQAAIAYYRARAEADYVRLAIAMQQLDEAIVITDLEGKIIYVNPAIEKISGYKPEEVIGKNSNILKSGIQPPSFYEHLWKTITQGEVWRGNITNRRKDGSLYQEKMIISPIRNTMTRITHYVAVKTDISQEIIIERQLQQAQKLEAIGQLAAGIAHEINTPTQFIGINVRFLEDSHTTLLALLTEFTRLLEAAKIQKIPGELLENLEESIATADLPFLTDEIPQAIQACKEGVQRVTTIVQAMREFSHPGSEEKTPSDLNHAIESTATVSRNHWKYVADLRLDLDPDLPQVNCVLNEINQVILNLITNAADAISSVVGDGSTEKGLITISTRRVNDWAEIHVSDTGCGIPEKIGHEIFNPFFTTKGIGKGTGQGLTLSHNIIVNKHNGSITFESAPGIGTTFIIRLPL